MHKRGFTLLELLFVLGVFTIVMSIVLPSIKGIYDEMNIAKAKTDLSVLQTALESYYNEHNIYPENDFQNTLINEQDRVINKNYYDPFNTAKVEYQYYKVPNKNYYVIYSLGMNRQPDLELGILIDLNNATLTVPTSNDDILVTNLKTINSN